MPRLRSCLAMLLRNDRGAMVVEFALLAPAFLMMVFGVMYVGMGLQNYNAIRNLSADVARQALVQQQNGNNLSPSQIRTFAFSRAGGAPYMLDPSRLEVLVDDADTQRITGVRELEVVVTYQVDNMLEFAGIPAPFFTYTRPVFLSTS